MGDTYRPISCPPHGKKAATKIYLGKLAEYDRRVRIAVAIVGFLIVNYSFISILSKY